ncbi:MAG: DUF1800 family protein [Armatimonadetes bacterium]|nr:DUF1800 family protein [Armatimonadota bacterium]
MYFFRARAGVATSLCLAALSALSLPAFAQSSKVRPVIVKNEPRPLVGDDAISVSDAVRFLEQCTFGPTTADIARVQQIGYAAFIDEQFAAPTSNYNFLYYQYGGRGIKVRFVQNAVRKPDQLRQRVAFALSQVVVINMQDGVFGDEDRIAAMIPYENALLRQGLGNYRDLLRDVTLTPGMGAYLNMLNNPKRDPNTNTNPNENFSRELLQLFALGVYQLNENGTVKTDVGGNPIPAYGNEEVTEFARVFTGWTHAPRYGASFGWFNYYPPNYPVPMEIFGPLHDTGAKTLFGGTVLPALPGNVPTWPNSVALQNYGRADLNAAVDNIFAHNNVPPFVVTRLIQHLVTANPSPAYVSRVVQVFKNNGSGVRGDMKAVVKAILLDNEARSATVARTTPGYGHWRSGVLYITNLLRQLDAQGDLCGIENIAAEMGQNPLSPPSVFSYYTPGYTITTKPNNVIYGAPEAQNFTTVTAIRRINFANEIVRTGTIGGSSFSGKTNVTGTSLAAFQAVALDTPALVNLVNERFLHGEMTVAIKNAVTTAVDALPATEANRVNRAKTAVYLATASQEYQVQR